MGVDEVEVEVDEVEELVEIIYWPFLYPLILCVQVFHLVFNYTLGEIDLVGYLQLPTFFLLSGFCLALGTFLNAPHLPYQIICSQDMDHNLNHGSCLTSTLPAFPAFIRFTSPQISSHLLAGRLNLSPP